MKMRQGVNQIDRKERPLSSYDKTVFLFAKKMQGNDDKVNCHKVMDQFNPINA